MLIQSKCLWESGVTIVNTTYYFRNCNVTWGLFHTNHSELTINLRKYFHCSMLKAWFWRKGISNYDVVVVIIFESIGFCLWYHKTLLFHVFLCIFELTLKIDIWQIRVSRYQSTNYTEMTISRHNETEYWHLTKKDNFWENL